jgi:hypothetical protein
MKNGDRFLKEPAAAREAPKQSQVAAAGDGRPGHLTLGRAVV